MKAAVSLPRNLVKVFLSNPIFHCINTLSIRPQNMRFEIVILVAVLWVLWLFDLPSKWEFSAMNDVRKSEMDTSVVVVSIACP